MLTDAASINEDLIGFALDGKADKVANRWQQCESPPDIAAVPSTPLRSKLRTQLTGMEQASSKNDTLGTALVAVEAYRVIENAMDTDSRPSPLRWRCWTIPVSS